MSKDQILINALNNVRDYLEFRAENQGSVVSQKAVELIDEALAAHHQQGGKEEKRDLCRYELSLVLYRVIKALKKKDPSGEYEKLISDANRIISKYSSPLDALRSESSPSTVTGGWVKAAGMKDGIYPVKFISKLSGAKMYGVGQVLNGEIPLARFYNGTTLSSSDPDVDAYVLSDTAPAIDIKKEVVAFDQWKHSNGWQQYLGFDTPTWWKEKPLAGKQTYFSSEELYSLYKQSI